MEMVLVPPDNDPSFERFKELLVMEYDPFDGKKLPISGEKPISYSNSKYYVERAKLARYARQDGKLSYLKPTEFGEPVYVCYQIDFDLGSGGRSDQSRFFIVGESGIDSQEKQKNWLISFGFDQLVRVTNKYIDLVRDGVRYRLEQGSHEYREDENRMIFNEAPMCVDPDVSIKVLELVSLSADDENKAISPANSAMQSAPNTLIPSNWSALEIPLPETPTVDESRSIAARYFETAVEGIFSHVSQLPKEYLTATQFNEDGDPLPIHLPAISMDGRYYQATTSSSKAGTVLKIQRVQPGSKQDSIGDALERLTLDEFNALLDEPEQLGELFDDALTESQLLLIQVPAGEVIVIGGDDYEKRLEPKDEPYLPIVRKTTELLKAYIEQVEKLPVHIETLYDKRRALAERLLAQQALSAVEVDSLSKESKVRFFMRYLWRTFTDW